MVSFEDPISVGFGPGWSTAFVNVDSGSETFLAEGAAFIDCDNGSDRSNVLSLQSEVEDTGRALSSFVCFSFLFNRLTALDSLDILVEDGIFDKVVSKDRGSSIEI